MSLLVSGSTVQLNDTVQVLSQFDFSGSTNPKYHLASTISTRDLILSSANATVTVSGALKVKDLGGVLTITNGGLSSTNASAQNYTLAVSSTLGFNVARLQSSNASAAGLQVGNASLILKSSGEVEVYATNSSMKYRLIVTGSDVGLLGVGNQLILSSSDAIAMSAALKVMFLATTGSLPVANAITGSIVWVDDAKCFAGYGPAGWVPFLTGSPFVIS